MTWQPISTAPKDRRILLKRESDGAIYDASFKYVKDLQRYEWVICAHYEGVDIMHGPDFWHELPQ